MSRKVFVWDPLVRVFHWLLAAGFLANALFTDAESGLHRAIGYGLMGLIGLRVIWGLVGNRHARFSDFRPDLVASVMQLSEMAIGRRHIHAGHSPLGALMIYNLLATITAIGITGWMMTTLRFFGVAWVEDLHVTLVIWAGISVAVHVAAVLIESRRLGVNLPRSMVTGYKSLPDDFADE